MNTQAKESLARLARRSVAIIGIILICAGTVTTNNSCTVDGIFGKGSASGSDMRFSTHLRVRTTAGDDTDSFQRGDEIQLVLTVRNRSGSSRTLNFTTTRISDFVIVEADTDNVVWQASDTIPFSETATSESFEDGQTKTYTATWNMILSNGGLLQEGDYEARGALDVDNNFDTSPLAVSEVGSTTERFTVN
jgi:hypothetical protein